MGLDMYLEKRVSIIQDVGYWRKANAIHYWFVRNVQDCVDDNGALSYVDKEKLMGLLDICRQVKDDNSLAEKLLPTQSGYFFGSTEYDDYYFLMIDDTIDILEEALEGEDGDFYYTSFW